MSTATPVAPEVQYPHIKEGTEMLEKRLLPAKLAAKDNAGRKTGWFFNNWFLAKQIDIRTLTAKALCDEMYVAVQADCIAARPELAWITPPKTLMTRVNQDKAPATRPDAREASTFEERVRASEKSDQQKREQEQAKKRCQVLVEQFAPTDHRRGTLKFDLRDSKQAAWRKKIAEAKDFTKLETEIRQEQRKIYESLERAAERV